MQSENKKEPESEAHQALKVQIYFSIKKSRKEIKNVEMRQLR